MTVQEFLATLNNPTAAVSIQDNDGEELIKMYAAGYQQLVAELLESVIEQVTMVTPQNITVKLVATD